MAGLELLPCPSGPQSSPWLATWGGCATPPRQFLLEAAKVPWISQTTPKPRGLARPTSSSPQCSEHFWKAYGTRLTSWS